MKYTFRPTTNSPTHRRLADDVTGILRAHADSVTIEPASAQVNPEGYELLPPALEPDQLATAADIAAHRYTREESGVVVSTSSGQHLFDTSRENRSMWLAVQIAAQANPTLSQGWKTLDHGFVLLTNADILVVAAAVYAHVADCFRKESVLLAAPAFPRENVAEAFDQA